MENDLELPVGFSMELAQHSAIMNQFAQLPRSEQQTIIAGAKQVQSHDEMCSYVCNLFQKKKSHNS